MIWTRYALVHLLRHWLQHWLAMVFLGWCMDLGTRVGGGIPPWSSPELWERWVFLALLLMPLSLFTALYQALSQWKKEKTLELLCYVDIGFANLWKPYVIFFMLNLLVWFGLREYLYPRLIQAKGSEFQKDAPLILENTQQRWTLYPSHDLRGGQALLEIGEDIRHYQEWSWEKRGLTLGPGKNTSQNTFVQKDQLSLRELCPSFEHMLILRGLGSDLSLGVLWDYRHLFDANLELLKRGLQPLMLLMFLGYHWRGALRKGTASLASSMSKSSLLFGFVMLALENLL